MATYKKNLEDPVLSPEQTKQSGSWTFTHEPMVILPKRTTGIRLRHYFITCL